MARKEQAACNPQPPNNFQFGPDLILLKETGHARNENGRGSTRKAEVKARERHRGVPPRVATAWLGEDEAQARNRDAPRTRKRRWTSQGLVVYFRLPILQLRAKRRRRRCRTGRMVGRAVTIAADRGPYYIIVLPRIKAHTVYLYRSILLPPNPSTDLFASHICAFYHPFNTKGLRR